MKKWIFIALIAMTLDSDDVNGYEYHHGNEKYGPQQDEA